MKKYKVAIVGATGAVGEEMLKVLGERDFPLSELKLLASSRSAGRRLTFKRAAVAVGELTESSFAGVDIALFSAGSNISKKYAPLAAKAGAVVIDNSSAFRMDPEVPLVVPEVNPQEMEKHKGIIANPNCSTIQLVVVLKPLHNQARIKRLVVSTYQSVSGTGRDAMKELTEQSKVVLAGHPAKIEVYPHQIAFNLIPHIDDFVTGAYTKEELKLVNETRKILKEPDLKITATAVRVPVLISHSESVNIEMEEKLSASEAHQILEKAPGVTVIDDPGELVYPTPVMAAGKDDCFVGRIREDDSVASGLNLWIVTDNLRKGAALNAVQIAELLV